MRRTVSPSNPVPPAVSSPSTMPKAAPSPVVYLAMRTRRGYPADLEHSGAAVAKQAVGHGVDQGLPGGFDDVGVHADGLPGRLTVGGLHEYARDGVRAVRGVDDAHAVVDELEL